MTLKAVARGEEIRSSHLLVVVMRLKDNNSIPLGRLASTIRCNELSFFYSYFLKFTFICIYSTSYHCNNLAYCNSPCTYNAVLYTYRV